MSIIGLTAVLALPCVSLSAPCVADEKALRDECSAFSQAGMRECLAKHVTSSEQALKAAEGKLKAALSRWDEERRYVGVAGAKYSASVHAFERGRDAQCAFAAALGGGAVGNALEIRRLACVAASNYLRASQLESSVAGLGMAGSE